MRDNSYARSKRYVYSLRRNTALIFFAWIAVLWFFEVFGPSFAPQHLNLYLWALRGLASVSTVFFYKRGWERYESGDWLEDEDGWR